MDNRNGSSEKSCLEGLRVALCNPIKGYMVKGSTYGKYGDYVTVISDHGNVLIVEGRTGRFPAPRDQVRKISPDELHRIVE